jgi:hypothetical protein
MSTIVQTFYHYPTTVDFTGSGIVDIRKLGESLGPTDSTTITQHGSGTGAAVGITLYPYHTSSTVSDISMNLGWGINKLGTDGMGATATALRVIPAGTWTSILYGTAPAGGTGTGAVSIYFIPKIYTVASNGTRTLLGTGTTSNVITSNAINPLLGSMTSTFSFPEVVLQASQTLEIGYVGYASQTAGVAGAVVAMNINWSLNSAAALQIPTPGIRTRYPQTLADTLSTIVDALSSRTLKVRVLIDTVSIADTINRLTRNSRTLADTVSVAESLKSANTLRRNLSDTLSSGTTVVYNRSIVFFEG